MIKLIQEYFTASAEKYPNNIAVDVWHEEKKTKKEALEMSFSRLDQYSNQLARHLKSKGVKRGDRVALMFMKIASVDAIASILAILKCDAVYVPIGHNLPAARVAKILDDSGAKLLIYRLCPIEELKKQIKRQDLQFIKLDYDDRLQIYQESTDPLPYANTSDDAAYIMYTSGSTGNPKGVMITHANIINATDWAVEEFGITSEDKMSQHPPLSFDLSTFDLYCAFKTGATLYPVSDNLSLFPGELIKFIEETGLTVWNSVPSVMVYLWNSGLIKPDRLPTLRKIFFNGEGFPARYLAEWMKTYPDKQFVNMYGPTETTVQCSFYRIPAPPTDLTKLVPIGKATGGMEIFAVDGELYVGGKGVGLGYWHNPQKTAESFIEFPGKGRVYKTGDLVSLRGDGNYEFIGRKDNQVKVRGNRIELGDVDAALYSLPYVNEAVAIAIPDIATDGNKLVVFVDLKDKKEEQYIKEDLAKTIPNYMIPDEVRFSKLPKTSTGKIDRPKLKNDYLRSKN